MKTTDKTTSTEAAKPSAQERAAEIEKRITALRAERTEIEKRRPKVSPRELALAHLDGSAKSLPSAAEFGAIQDELARVDMLIEGMIELRIELEADVLREQKAALEAERARFSQRSPELHEKVQKLRRELEAAEFEGRDNADRITALSRDIRRRDQALWESNPENEIIKIAGRPRFPHLRERLMRLATGEKTSVAPPSSAPAVSAASPLSAASLEDNDPEDFDPAA